MLCAESVAEDVNTNVFNSKQVDLSEGVCRQLDFFVESNSPKNITDDISDISNRSVNSLSPDQKEVNISGEQMMVIPKILETCSWLESLDLSRNSILTTEQKRDSTLREKFSLDTYSDFEREVDINETVNQDTDLSYCNDFNFSTLTNLSVLNLSYNKLTTWLPGLTLLSHLSHIDLSHNQISQLPDQIACSKSLRYLDLSHNCLEIDQTPTWLVQLVNCSTLKLSHNPSCLPFPPQFGNKGRKLKYLHLNNTSLAQFPPELTSLLNLRHLYLSNQHGTSPKNSLVRLPPTIVNLVGLTKLELVGVGLYELPDSLGTMNKLEILDASHNNISWLPDSLVHMFSLRVLSVSFNKLIILPLDFVRLTSLQHLMVSHNRLSELPENIFNSLITLDVYQNQITAIPNRMVECPSLNRCDLASNYIVFTKEEQDIIGYKELQDNLRNWDGRLGEWGSKELVKIDTSTFRSRLNFEQENKETEEVTVDNEIDECCDDHSHYKYCSCEYYYDIYNTGSEQSSDETRDELFDDNTNMVEVDPDTDEDWDNLDKFSPTKLGIKYNLDRMDLDHSWGGRGNFCPADIHNTPFGDQLGKRWEKAIIMKASQHVGRNQYLRREDCQDELHSHQFDDAV